MTASDFEWMLGFIGICVLLPIGLGGLIASYRDEEKS